MELIPIDRVANISREDFRKNYFIPQKPLVITDLAKSWPAYTKWNWDYFKFLVGQEEVNVYNNIRAGAKVPFNGSDGRMLFGEYLDLIQAGPVELRIFLFNIFKYAPQLIRDFTYPDDYSGNFLKKYPMLFVGGEGSIAHMHYDVDLSDIFHTQFIGKKRVLLMPQSQSSLIYNMPLTIESAASFVNWHNGVDTKSFPALAHVKGYETILNHGETMFMPSGFWHHLQYMESGFAMSLRALPEGIIPKLNSIYHLLPMRGLNNLLIRLAPEWWYNKKRELAHVHANRAMSKLKKSSS